MPSRVDPRRLIRYGAFALCVSHSIPTAAQTSADEDPAQGPEPEPTSVPSEADGDEADGDEAPISYGPGVDRPVSPLTGPVVGADPTGFAKRSIGPLGLMSAGGPDGLQGGGALLIRGAALIYGHIVSARYLERHWIGYDTAGTTYSLSAQVGIGARLEFDGNQGPFARVEARGEMQRMGGWYHSSLRLPGAQLGYGLDRGPWMLDVFAHASPSWTGRIRTREFTRPVEGAFVGGAFSLGWNNWLWHGDASHLLTFDGPFWDVRSSLCSYWGKKPTRLEDGRVARHVGPRSADYSMGICTDFASLTFPRNDNLMKKTDFGLSIVFGAFSRLDRTRVP